MNILIWIVTALVAAAFMMVGIMKATQPKEKLEKQMPWVNDLSDSNIRYIGILEVLGALGLLLPRLTGVLPFLSVLAALGLIATMISAATLHIRRKETFVPNLVLGVLTAVTLLSSTATQVVGNGSAPNP
jgi:uncharacterized membrane protein